MTLKELTEKNYMILNGKINHIEVYKNGADKLFIRLFISGDGWECVYGDFELTKEDYDGFSSLTNLMNILEIYEISQFNDTYVRVAVENVKHPIKIIGNIVFDKWYNFEDYSTVQINRDESNLSNNMETVEEDNIDE